MSAGVALLASAAEPIAFIAIFSYGVGLGLTIPATNLYVSNASGEARASALNVLNMAWGAGGGRRRLRQSPSFTGRARPDWFLIGLATALVLMTVPLLRLPRPAPGGVVPEAEAETASAAPARAHTVLFGALLFLYVGTETSVAGWVALYARRFDLIPAALSIAAPSLFWAALLAGRGAAPLILRRVSERRLLGAGLILASAGVSALLIADSAASLAVAVIVAGAGLSTIFPLTVAQFTRDSNTGSEGGQPSVRPRRARRRRGSAAGRADITADRKPHSWAVRRACRLPRHERGPPFPQSAVRVISSPALCIHTPRSPVD